MSKCSIMRIPAYEFGINIFCFWLLASGFGSWVHCLTLGFLIYDANLLSINACIFAWSVNLLWVVLISLLKMAVL